MAEVGTLPGDTTNNMTGILYRKRKNTTSYQFVLIIIYVFQKNKTRIYAMEIVGELIKTIAPHCNVMFLADVVLSEIHVERKKIPPVKLVT